MDTWQLDHENMICILWHCMHNHDNVNIIKMTITVHKLAEHHMCVVCMTFPHTQVPHPLRCLQMACVPVTISRTSPSHSSTHHSLWCTSCTKQPQELSTWQESYLLWVCSSSLHPCHETCQSQQAAKCIYKCRLQLLNNSARRCHSKYCLVINPPPHLSFLHLYCTHSTVFTGNKVLIQ